MAYKTIRELARRWFEGRAWQEARETTIAAGERWVLGDEDPDALTDSEREELFGWVRQRMATINAIPSAVADAIAADLRISQQGAAALCVATEELS
jgi:hypothetical protein